MVMTALPSIFLIKKIGKAIDRHPSKAILVKADLTSAILITVIALLLSNSLLTLPLALAFGFAGSVMQAFIDPTLNKALAEVVSKEDFEGGLSLLATTQSLANFTGAVLGALLIDVLGFGGTAVLAAGCYFVSSIASQWAQFNEVKKSAIEEDSRAGWEVLQEYPLLKRLIIGFGLVNFFATPTLVVLPVYVKKVLFGSASVLGSLEAALWLGLLAGSLVSRFVVPSWNKIQAGVLCLSLFGISLGTPGLVVSAPLYAVALIVAGLSLGVNNVKFMSLFQETVAPEMKGRFFALMQGVIGFSFPIAYFLFGAMTDHIEVTRVCLIQGAGVALLALYFVPLIQRSPA